MDADYNIAMEAYNEGKIAKALKFFELTLSYKDSYEYYDKCNYSLGLNAFEKENYSLAKLYFFKL